MIYRILDENGDYQFGKGRQNFTYGSYAVAQAIKTRLKLLKAEWWENTEEGLPLFQQILGQNGTTDNIMIADSLIKERILNTEKVLSIEEFKSEYSKRSYTFSCKANSEYGTIILNNISL